MIKFINGLATRWLERQGYSVLYLKGSPVLAIGGMAVASTRDLTRRDWYVSFQSPPFIVAGGASAIIDQSEYRGGNNEG